MSEYYNFKLNNICAVHIGASVGIIMGVAHINSVYNKTDSYIMPLLLVNSGVAIGYSVVNYFKKN